MLTGLLDDLKRRIDGALKIAVAGAVAAAAATAAFACLAVVLFLWTQQNYGTMEAWLALAGLFAAVAAIGGIVVLAVRRRVPPVRREPVRETERIRPIASGAGRPAYRPTARARFGRAWTSPALGAGGCRRRRYDEPQRPLRSGASRARRSRSRRRDQLRAVSARSRGAFRSARKLPIRLPRLRRMRTGPLSTK